MSGRIQRRRRNGANSTNAWRVSNVTPRQAASPSEKETSTPTGDINIYNDITLLVESPLVAQAVPLVQNQPPRSTNHSNAVPAPREAENEDAQGQGQVQAPPSAKRRHGHGRRGGVVQVFADAMRFLLDEITESSSEDDSSMSGSTVSCSCSECLNESSSSSSDSCGCSSHCSSCDCSGCEDEDVFVNSEESYYDDYDASLY